MNEAILHLPPDLSIRARLKLAKEAIASSDNDLRRAAEHIAAASKQGASQRQIASSIGKSPAYVNRLLSWHSSGYQDETPFGPESKAKRARVQAAERTENTKKLRPSCAQDKLAAAATAPGTKTSSAVLPPDGYHLPPELNQQDTERAFQRLARQWSSNPFRDLLLDSPKAAQKRFVQEVLLPAIGEH